MALAQVGVKYDPYEAKKEEEETRKKVTQQTSTVPKPPAPKPTTYSAPKINSSLPTAPKTQTETNSSSENDIRDKYTNQINNEIARYEKQMNDELARLREQGQATIGRNNEYLDQQIQRLQEQKAVADNQAANLENRRGGFYSGGLDYRLAQNDRATQQATGQVQSEIGSRNAEIEKSNNLVAQQVADQVSMLRQQAPDKIRDLVDAALERQYAKQFQERQFAFQQQQARASAARAAASQALAAQRLQAQQTQQQWENDFRRDQFDWQKEQANQSPASGSNMDSDAYTSFTYDLYRPNEPIKDMSEGYRLIDAYRNRGVSNDVINQMVKDLNDRFRTNGFDY